MNIKKFSQMEKDVLLKERARVYEELTHLREMMRVEVDIDPDEGDADISEREKDVVLIEILERTLRDIDRALLAIDSGRYGICERCNNPIPPERLEARPDATLCVVCQQEVERLRRRRGQSFPTLGMRRQNDSWANEIQTSSG